MADVTGAISTLPGSYHRVPKGQTCDSEFIEHMFPVSATHRIQGETDSFGSEMFDCCDACHAAYKASCEEHGPLKGACNWCKTGPHVLYPTRDYGEGSSGPVYDVCSSCRTKQLDELRAELDGDDDDDNGFDDGDWPEDGR